MSELSIKRNKLVKELSKQQRLNYFKIRRNEMLSNKEEIQQEGMVSHQTVWLKQIANRSLITDQLLEDIERHSLLKTIEYISHSTINGRDIEIILIILSNVLLDHLSLDSKQQIARLCLSCYQMKVFDDYSSNLKDCNLNCMLSIAHSLNSLSRVVNNVQEELGVKCQQSILREVIKILQQLQSCIRFVDTRDQKEVYELVDKITNAINGLIYCEKEYMNQFYSRFQRNFSSFYQILKLHASFAFMNFFNPILKQIHQKMLDIQEYLTTTVSMANFQIYFQSTELISIILKEIYENRDELLNRRALIILNNLLRQYQDTDILTLMSLIEADIHLKDKFIFFTKLLYKDTLKKERMKIVEHFLTNNHSYIVFQPFFERYWRQIVDVCCQMLQEEDSQLGLSALSILIESKFRYFETYAYLSYLKSIGLYNFLDQKSRLHKQSFISEEFQSRVSFLLKFLRQDEENII